MKRCMAKVRSGPFQIKRFLSEHVARKSRVLYEVKESFVLELKKKNEQYGLFTNLELPLSRVLGEMEYMGVKVDTNRLLRMGEDLSVQLQAIEKKDIHELAGSEFNINSPKQLGVIFI
ncbi:hypothetical protein GCM10020331_032600 [Ectobacillus funiculus]